jgi:hypothetical protein
MSVVRRKRQRVANPNSKEHIHSTLIEAVNALNIWCINILDKERHAWTVFSRTCATQCNRLSEPDRFNSMPTSTSKRRRIYTHDPFTLLRERVDGANYMSPDELFNNLKARVFCVAPGKDKSKSCIEMLVATPDLMMMWLQHPRTFEQLTERQEAEGRLGNLIHRCYDLPEYVHYGEVSRHMTCNFPKRYLSMATYLMVLLLLMDMSPHVSIYKDLVCVLRPRGQGPVEISLRLWIPEKLEWCKCGENGEFMVAYSKVMYALWTNQMVHVNDLQLNPLDVLLTQFRNYPMDPHVNQRMNVLLDFRKAHCSKVVPIHHRIMPPTIPVPTPSYAMVPVHSSSSDVIVSNRLPGINDIPLLNDEHLSLPPSFSNMSVTMNDDSGIDEKIVASKLGFLPAIPPTTTKHTNVFSLPPIPPVPNLPTASCIHSTSSCSLPNASSTPPPPISLSRELISLIDSVRPNDQYVMDY